MNLIKRLIREEEGQGLTEYALVLAVVVIIAAAVGTIFRNDIKALFTDVGNDIKDFELE
jgi:pilus assembly protein Flp/PilA